MPVASSAPALAALAQPGDQGLMAVAVGELALLEGLILLLNGHRQGRRTDIDAAEHHGCGGLDCLLIGLLRFRMWSRLPSLSADTGSSLRADLEHAGSKGLRFSTA